MRASVERSDGGARHVTWSISVAVGVTGWSDWRSPGRSRQRDCFSQQQTFRRSAMNDRVQPEAAVAQPAAALQRFRSA